MKRSEALSAVSGCGCGCKTCERQRTEAIDKLAELGAFEPDAKPSSPKQAIAAVPIDPSVPFVRERHRDSEGFHREVLGGLYAVQVEGALDAAGFEIVAKRTEETQSDHVGPTPDHHGGVVPHFRGGGGAQGSIFVAGDGAQELRKCLEEGAARAIKRRFDDAVGARRAAAAVLAGLNLGKGPTGMQWHVGPGPYGADRIIEALTNAGYKIVKS